MRNTMPLISFIIPVYNSKGTLDRCLKSVFDCTGYFYEIILIDDASSDGSAALCSRYASRYDNVKYVRTDVNKGPGNARNMGIDIAKGKYYCFLDSDDEINAKVLPKLAEVMVREEPDFIYMKHLHIWPNGEVRQKGVNLPEGFMDVGDFLEKYPDKPCSPAWICAYRAQFLWECGLRFAEAYYFEDNGFLVSVFMNAKTIFILPESLYRYQTLSDTSLTKNNKYEYVLEGFRFYFEQNASLSSITKKRAAVRSLEICMYKIFINFLEKLPLSTISEEFRNLEKLGVTKNLPALFELYKEHGAVSCAAQWLRNVLVKIGALTADTERRVLLCPANKFSHAIGKMLTQLGGKVSFLDNNPSDANYYVKLCRDDGFDVFDVKAATPGYGNIILIYHNAYPVVEEISHQLDEMHFVHGVDYLSIYPLI